MTGALKESYWPPDTSEAVVELTVGDLLRQVAAEAPDRTALVAGVPDPAGRRRWTYAELVTSAERTARGLLGRFRPGEHVAIWAPNVSEWVVLQMGAALAGLVVVTVNPAFRSQELAYVLGQSRAAGIVLMREFRGNPMYAALESVRPDLPDLREVILLEDLDAVVDDGDPAIDLPPVVASDPVMIQYTSGTTGFPKGALLHHRGIVNNARFTTRRSGIARGGVCLNPMPMFHTGGCVMGSLGALASAATHVPVLAFDPGLVLELIEAERATFMLAVPTMLIAMIEHPAFTTRDLSSLIRVTSGGALVPEALVERIESSLGSKFSIVFGQTESSPVATQTAWDDTPTDKGTTIGTALPQTEVKIADPITGATLPVGEVGELWTRGYLVMLGYFDKPEATAEAITSDGWLRTGDLCSMDERGYCKVEGRLKDMIIRGGENVYPKEIEELLFARPDVAEVAVVGLPDDRWGESVAAVVRRAGGSSASARELFAHCREHLAPHKAPRSWAFVDAFPLTTSGKIQKFVLREQMAKGVLPSETV